jgi:hypothetical protein
MDEPEDDPRSELHESSSANSEEKPVSIKDIRRTGKRIQAQRLKEEEESVLKVRLESAQGPMKEAREEKRRRKQDKHDKGKKRQHEEERKKRRQEGS